MIGLRRRLAELDARGEPIRVGVVGVGQMGRGLIAQIAGIDGMRVSIASDLDVDRVRAVFAEVGDEDAEASDDAIAVAGADDVDVVVDATGIPEIGARVATEAIEHGKHVVMLNVEADVTVGRLLAERARSAGVVYTGAAGDEPGATLELYEFARSLGFEVTVAGKGKNNPLDLLATPDSLADEAEEKRMNPKMLASFVDGTKTMVEMAALANATGLVPDVPGMHGVAEDDPQRLPERLDDVLSRRGVVEYVRGIAPGVFVMVRAEEGPVRETLRYVGLGDGPEHVLYRPYHLTSLETPHSIALAAIYGEPTIAPGPAPVAEVVAMAKRDLAPGDTLGGIGGADYHGWLRRAEEARELLPLGLAERAVMRSPVATGKEIPLEAVELWGESAVGELRRNQDQMEVV